MLQAMYNGVSAINVTQQNMDVIGNNIANVNTDGFKASTVTFATQLSDTIKAAAGPTSSTGGTNPDQIGLGVQIGTIGVNTSQGALASTSIPTDMAINGNGYFQVASGSGSSINYTRDGSFALDSTGELVQADTGEPVLGWTATPTGAVNTSAPITSTSTLSIGIGTQTSALATSGVTFAGQLSSDDAVGATYSRSVNVYDSQGTSHTITLNFTRAGTTATAGTEATATSTASSALAGQVYTGQITIGGTAYSLTSGGASGDTLGLLNADISGSGYQASVSGGNQLVFTATATPCPGGAPAAVDLTGLSAGSTSAAANQTVTFGAVANVNGTAATAAGPTNVWSWTATGDAGLATPTGTTNEGTVTFDGNGDFVSQTGSITLNPQDTASQGQVINPNFSALNQVSGSSTAAPASQNGYPSGTLQSFAVDQNGVINGTFSNGQTAVLGQIALATFQNPGGLTANGPNTFTSSSNSGPAVTSAANENGLGTIQANYLEQSNVDLGTEFTNMIIAQRSFQANTKIVTAVDQMLSDLISMKQ